MGKLKADGTPRKKYVSKKMRLARIRKNGQKKAWETRKALYPETNGFKPKMVEEEDVGNVECIAEIAEAKNPAGQGIGQVAEARKQTIKKLTRSYLDLEKKLEAADAVNRNLKGMMQKFQVEGAENRIKIEKLEGELKKKVQPIHIQDQHELITALQHDLKLADKEGQRLQKRAEALEGADRKVLDLAHENALLLGELRGANYCFDKLSEAIAKGGTHG